ncbi:hypothetical protein L202_07161 [Cryptococcus amylolentus CBS 6039]|uniref:Nodulin-like domain-containing protein n=1 Tax=Cryptococcus amylolentus CBS 6039 TaxID=1295533 RepID=A0A1E3HGH2_9TREE|nr:hypothetical protein L202_07161 [Cryptococcus amylolentus CBS 6039]ODN74856.1 hypothetical protein L202_07161 [Cryptococcus amylolentus CBS 6039]
MQSRQSSRTRLIPILDKETPPQRTMSWDTLNPFGPRWTSADRKRAGVFFLSVVVGLASGSNYVYSAYAPQLANQLQVSATTVNLVGLAGNFGVYTTGPLWGKIVDSRGQKIPLLTGGLCCLLGYSLVHAFYTHSIPIRSSSSSDISTPRLAFLMLSMFLTGAGGSAGLASAVNAVAKSFPDATRASATGAVLAGFGLSAFLFSFLGHLVWPGDSGGLLGLLAVGTSVPMLIGGLFIRPVFPEEARPEYEHLDQDEPGVEVVVEDYDSPALSRTTSLEMSRSIDLSRSRSPARGRDPHHPHAHAHFAPLPHPSHPSHPSHPPHKRSQSLSSLPPTSLHHSPLDILQTPDFWLLFTILALLCGTGLMYINNAGTVVLALGREGHMQFDREKISGWQAKQVGLVSIWNCSGRLIGGFYSDFIKSKYRISRIWTLPLVSLLFIISQLSALSTTHASSLWAVSSLLGVAYGALFNVMPMLVLEWFGMRHFSQNWGWTSVAPIIGSNGFNLVFGKVYDAHTVGKIGYPSGETPPDLDLPLGDSVQEAARGFLEAAVGVVKRAGGVPVPDDGSHDCLVGNHCYTAAFQLSSLACVLALGLSLVAGVRRERMGRERRRVLMEESGQLPPDGVHV